MLQHAQALVYSLISLMPSVCQKASLKAVLGLFLDAQGHALPAHTQIKSASSLSRFLNHYRWSTRQVIRTTRAAILRQLSVHPVPAGIPVRLLIDLSTLKKTGKFWHLSTPTEDINAPEPWVRMLNGKRGLHLVKGRIVIVQADTEFGTIEFLGAVRQRQWRAVVGVKNSRLLPDGRKLKDLPGNAKRGLQLYLKDIDYPLTISWFWLKRADNKRELCFVASTKLSELSRQNRTELSSSLG